MYIEDVNRIVLQAGYRPISGNPEYVVYQRKNVRLKMVIVNKKVTTIEKYSLEGGDKYQTVEITLDDI